MPGDHIGRAAHDIEQAAGAGIDLAHIQAVGIGMLGHFHHLGHHHLGKWRGDDFHFFHFEAGHGQQVGQLIRAQLRVGHRAQPVF
jgi:hypothetical protein